MLTKVLEKIEGCATNLNVGNDFLFKPLICTHFQFHVEIKYSTQNLCLSCRSNITKYIHTYVLQYFSLFSFYVFALIKPTLPSAWCAYKCGYFVVILHMNLHTYIHTYIRWCTIHMYVKLNRSNFCSLKKLFDICP